MKKIIYLASMLLCVAFAGCEKEDIGETATVGLAGDWYVVVDAVDENGEIVYEDADLFGIGKFHLLTYNASANNDNQLFVDDLGSFWEFKVKTDFDKATGTFGISDVEKYIYATLTDKESGEVISTYNNYSFSAKEFNQEAWDEYKAEKITLDDYFKIAPDTISSGIYVTAGRHFEIGAVDGDEDPETDDAEEDMSNTCNIVVENGSIMYNAATTPSGMPADSIALYVSFDDDPYPSAYGYAKYLIHGYRYTGLASDDE